jgi:polyisoprenoid-binding protein YceI
MKHARSLVLFVLSAAVLTALTISRGFAGAYQNQASVTYEAIPTGDYKIDPGHSVIGFSIRHFEISFVRGRFKEFNGMIRYDASDVTKSTVEFTAKTESIDTGVAGRDNHLRTADFFDVAKFPELTFKSTRVERKANNAYLLHGDFTLKGVTKQISFPFTIAGAVKDNRGNTRFGVAAETKINRRDYGITWGGPMASGGLNVGNEVMIDLQLEAVKAAPPASQ